MTRWSFIVYSAILLGITLGFDALNVLRCADGLSPFGLGDPFSEANSLRAGERYARDGFIVNYGLPASLYGKRFTDEGTLGRLKRSGEGSSPAPRTRSTPDILPDPTGCAGSIRSCSASNGWVCSGSSRSH